MESGENNWNVGETVTLTRSESLLKKHREKTYSFLAGGQYICVRKATDTQRGIAVRVLGQTVGNDITLVDGEPFCNDICENFSTRMRYYSYPLPTTDELKKVLELIRGNESLPDCFEGASMHFDPDATFWVQETAGHLAKKPQYYDAKADQICKTKGDAAHCRLTIAYYNIYNIEGTGTGTEMNRNRQK